MERRIEKRLVKKDIFKGGITSYYPVNLNLIHKYTLITFIMLDFSESRPLEMEKFYSQLESRCYKIKCDYEIRKIKEFRSNTLEVYVYPLYSEFWEFMQRDKSIMRLKAEFKLKYYGEGKKGYISRIAKYMRAKTF